VTAGDAGCVACVGMSSQGDHTVIVAAGWHCATCCPGPASLGRIGW
jgi:hypothetical protein